MKRMIALFTILLAIIGGARAQENHIIYTEYEPDTCFTFHSSNDTLKFDLDQDGTGDIVMFAKWHSAVGFIAVITTPSSDWQWSWTYASEFTGLTDTTLINGNLRWQYSGGNLAMYPEFTHFAFRHLTGDGYCYGWARIYVESLARVCMASMGYCDLADYPLQWGETELLTVKENDESATFATLYPNPTSGIVTITGENLHQVEVHNTLWQQILSVKGKGNELHIDMAALPSGIYFVTVTDEEGRKCVRKVVKE